PAGAGGGVRTVWLSSLDLSKAAQGWGKPQADKNVRGAGLISIGGRKFDHGFGMHAPGALHVDLKGSCTRLGAFVGVDDDVKGNPAASVTFEVIGERPETIEAPPEEAVILTPKPPRTPRINGPRVYGVRPGSPMLFTIPARRRSASSTGERSGGRSWRGGPTWA
ncbi:MAG: NPCBM/NEW2 domain-containing protein, partial [Phycisphaerae bacterium]